MAIFNLDTNHEMKCGSTHTFEEGIRAMMEDDGGLGDVISVNACVERNLAVEARNIAKTTSYKQTSPGVTSVYDIPNFLDPYESCVESIPTPVPLIPVPATPIPPIPFSPANVPNPPTELEVMKGAYIPNNPNLGPETKRRRDNYQEMVMCPGGETSEYMMGLESWASFQTIMNKLHVVTDMGLMEWLGFLTPVVVVGGIGYLFKSRGR